MEMKGKSSLFLYELTDWLLKFNAKAEDSELRNIARVNVTAKNTGLQ